MDEADLLGTQIKDEPIDVFCDDFYPESNDEEDDEIRKHKYLSRH